MAQWLGILAALPEDQGWGFNAVFWPPQTPAMKDTGKILFRQNTQKIIKNKNLKMVFKTKSYYGHSNSNLTSHMLLSKLLPSKCLRSIIQQNKGKNA